MVSASTAQAGGKEHFMAPFPSCQAGGLQRDGDLLQDGALNWEHGSRKIKKNQGMVEIITRLTLNHPWTESGNSRHRFYKVTFKRHAFLPFNILSPDSSSTLRFQSITHAGGPGRLSMTRWEGCQIHNGA